MIVDKPWEYYAKWKKPDTKGHMLYESIKWNIQNRQIHRDKKQISDRLGLGTEEWGVTVNTVCPQK